MKANTRLAGHELRNEGRVYDPHGYVQSTGVSRCSCGDLSPVLESAAARKRWHREHKAAGWAAIQAAKAAS